MVKISTRRKEILMDVLENRFNKQTAQMAEALRVSDQSIKNWLYTARTMQNRLWDRIEFLYNGGDVNSLEAIIKTHAGSIQPPSAPEKEELSLLDWKEDESGAIVNHLEIIKCHIEAIESILKENV
jgi:hypothetical protein